MSSTSSLSSIVYTILHYLRLVYNYILSFFSGGSSQHHHGGWGGIIGYQLTSFFNRSSSSTRILIFDNGTTVKMGKQIAEGGFSYVFEAFPVTTDSGGDNSGVGTPSKKSRMLLRSNSSSLTSSSMGDYSSDDYTSKRPIKKYALKRINCSDHHEIIQSCRHEAGIHRSLPVHHPNLLELLGLKFDNNANTSDDTNMSSSSSSSSSHGHGSNSQQHIEYNVCYMLFPYITNSLRDEITIRNIISHDISNNHQSQSASYNSTTTRRQPFSTKEVLHLFGGLLDAVTAMHNSNISHRDIKLENVLLNNNMTGYDDDGVATTTRGSSKSKGNRIMQPVLMDFGSAGQLTRQIKSRQDVLTIVEESASHTTLPYRPPELFDGGLRYYTNNNNNTEVLDYGKVDVWSLGCVLFGLMHGCSPYEMEYTRRGSNSSQHHQYGLVRVVECTHLKILDEVPLPPWASVGGKGVNDNDSSGVSDGKDGKYPLSIYKFVRYMVNHDRNQRPNIHEACQKFGELYLKLLGERWVPYEESGQNNMGDDDDFDSLIASRDFV